MLILASIMGGINLILAGLTACFFIMSIVSGLNGTLIAFGYAWILFLLLLFFIGNVILVWKGEWN
jgi:hypothetical protein